MRVMSGQQKAPGIGPGLMGVKLIGRLPSLPHTCACSTIGAEGLNFRVRDGNGWDPFATTTQNLSTLKSASEPVLGFEPEYLTGHCKSQGTIAEQHPHNLCGK